MRKNIEFAKSEAEQKDPFGMSYFMKKMMNLNIFMQTSFNVLSFVRLDMHCLRQRYLCLLLFRFTQPLKFNESNIAMN
jgi:hypothetical protein